jgi:thiosulfate/3-mercaptopyruvate sulfurtransferase
VAVALLVVAALAAELVDPAEGAALVRRGATVLDTRGVLAYLGGHIPGAVRVSWRIGVDGGVLSGRLGDAETAAAAFAALGVDDARPVLVVGAWDRGWGEEGRVAWDLAYLGHAEVSVLEGGMRVWTAGTARWPSAPAPGHFTARVDASVRAGRDQVGGTVVDVREPDEYAGATRYGEARGGHVEGAINLPWRDILAGAPVPDGPLVVYCTGGVRSAMVWLLLSARGHAGVRNYDGGWWEWARIVP